MKIHSLTCSLPGRAGAAKAADGTADGIRIQLRITMKILIHISQTAILSLKRKKS